MHFIFYSLHYTVHFTTFDWSNNKTNSETKISSVIKYTHIQMTLMWYAWVSDIYDNHELISIVWNVRLS